MDHDGQLSAMFTIRVRPVLIITVVMLHDYVILILHFADWVTVPNHFLLRSVNFQRSGQNKIDSIRLSTLCQAILPSSILSGALMWFDRTEWIALRLILWTSLYSISSNQ